MWSFDLAEIKDDIEGFPPEVVEKMLERQEEQAGWKDIRIFQHYKGTGRTHGGFNWIQSVEKGSFWNEVIGKGNFDVFFEKYPKQETQQDFLEIMKGFRDLRARRLAEQLKDRL